MSFPHIDLTLPEFSLTDELEDEHDVEFFTQHHLAAMREITEREMDLSLETVRTNIAHAEGLRYRARMLEAQGFISEEEYRSVETSVEHFTTEATTISTKLEDALGRLSDATVGLMESIGEGEGGIASQAAQKIREKVLQAKEKAKQALAKGQQTLSDAQAAVTDALAHQRFTTDEFQKVGDELHDAREEGDTARVTELTHEFDNLLTETMEAQDAFKNAKKALILAKNGMIQLAKETDKAIQAARVYDQGNFVTNAVVQGIAEKIGGYLDAFKKLSNELQRVRKLVQGGYEAFAKTLVEGKDASRFLEEVNDMTREEVLAEKGRVKKQLERINEIMASEGEQGAITEQVIQEASEWMSPSWRLEAAMDEDVIAFVAGLKFAGPLDFFVQLARSSALLVRSLVRLPLLQAFKILEYTLGVKTATAIADTGEALLTVTGDVVGKFFAPELQAVILAFYAFIDIFRVHNFGGWLNDMVSFFITAGLADTIDPLRILQYPKFSQKSDRTGDNPAKMWEIDHREFQTVIDFWGGVFVKEQNKLGGAPKTYRPYAPFQGLTRIPGLYIDPKNYPYDSEQEIEQCRSIENSLDIGTLVDKTGYISGADPGGLLVSNLIPRKEGLVRNLVTFPLYQNTVRWPNRDGEFIQTSGNFTEHAMDPTVVKLWKHWILSGEWGPAFHSDKSTAQSKQLAKQTNLNDLQQFLKPQREGPLAWIHLKEWADANAGVKTILSQDMYGVNLATLEKEMKTDYPVKGPQIVLNLLDDGRPIDQHQDTIEFATYLFRTTGRYPFTPQARVFYRRVIDQHKTKFFEKFRVGSVDNILYLISERESTPEEITLYTRVWDQITTYMAALKKTHGDIKKAWDMTFKETLWDLYVKDTSPRTVWGYITKVKTLLILELQQAVNLMVGDRKAQIWMEYLQRVSRAGIPLNTNRFHRLQFVGQMNQLVYAKTATKVGMIEKEIERVGGKILENKLITTGLSSLDLASWAKGLGKKAIVLPHNIRVDIPVYFGDLHCRIVLIEKPKQTCFVIFRGTTNFWEWVVDLDFTSAEYGSIRAGSAPGTFEMHLETQTDTRKSELERLRHGDPDKFALHRGFLRCWNAFKPTVTKVMMDLYKQYAIQDVIVTGHSLGAGITQIACLEFPSLPRPTGASTLPTSLYTQLYGAPPTIQYIRPHAYMYSSPAVGDTRFAWHFVNQTSESAQVYIDGDIITMIPFMLLPSLASWGEAVQLASINDIVKLAQSDSGASATIWTLISRLFKVGNLPSELDPLRWRTGDSFDFSKISSGLLELNIALNKHRAVHGGGVFMRLNNSMNGDMLEQPADPGNSDGALSVLAHAVIDTETIRARHSIDQVVKVLGKTARRHPDLFAEVDNQEFPQWGDAGTTIPPAIGPIPPSMEPVLKHGTVRAIGRLTHPYMRWQQVQPQHVDPDSIVMLPDVKTLKRKRQRQKTRYRKRCVMEGEYHGY